MSLSPNYVPRDFKTINFLLKVNDGEKALRFYNAAFGAEITEKLVDSAGIIQYAEIKIDDTTIILSEDRNFHGAIGMTLQIYTGDAEALLESVIKAGGIEICGIHRDFFGNRSGRVKDPFGYEWIVATHMEDVAPKELKRRFDQAFS
jgi:PhnB protein